MRMKTPAAVAAALALLTIASARGQQPQITQHRLPDEISFPEGVAYDAAGKALYSGSAATGAIVRLALDSNQSTIVSAPGALWTADPFPALLGMKVDGSGRLWVTGGRTGRMAVIDTRTGNVVKKFQSTTPDKSLINDVVVTATGAYFTDSFMPTLWHVGTKGGTVGDLEPWVEFTGGPLEYTSPGANLNGIAATPDGRTLIVVQMNKGLLFRIGVEDKKVVPIDVGGEALTAADGLVLDGRTLYIVRQGEQEIVTLELSADLSKGRVRARFKDPALMWPATAAKVGDRLLVVNTQFNKRTTKDPVTPFSIIGVPLSALSGK
jgi:Cu-Zn family superoxide dismutase